MLTILIFSLRPSIHASNTCSPRASPSDFDATASPTVLSNCPNTAAAICVFDAGAPSSSESDSLHAPAPTPTPSLRLDLLASPVHRDDIAW